jgi:outer membrane receptor protein involved in Fe transport
MMANYPVHNARQVEIVYGPASALYGADAFSAVVNIISKDVTEGSPLPDDQPSRLHRRRGADRSATEPAASERRVQPAGTVIVEA